MQSAGNHNHVVYGSNWDGGSDGIDTEKDEYHSHGMSYPTSYAGAHTHTIDSSGKGTPHNNMQPYEVIHRWKRTA